MISVLGIDPGSRVTGYGVIAFQEDCVKYICSGVINMPDGTLPHRLNQIFDGISQVVEDNKPELAVVEKVFVATNPNSALLLGHARGSAICACASRGVSIVEYSAREIKQAITGTGAASKQQMLYMVQMLLGRPEISRQDEADALAGAITYFHHQAVYEATGFSHNRESGILALEATIESGRVSS